MSNIQYEFHSAAEGAESTTLLARRVHCQGVEPLLRLVIPRILRTMLTSGNSLFDESSYSDWPGCVVTLGGVNLGDEAINYCQ